MSSRRKRSTGARRRVRIPLGALLAALVLVPTAGIGLIARREADLRIAQAEDARALQEIAVGFVALADLRGASGDEHIFNTAAVLMDNRWLNLTEEELAEAVGFDLASARSIYGRASEAAYERAENRVLASAASGRGSIPAVVAGEVQDAFDSVRQARRRVDERQATLTEVSAANAALARSLRGALGEMSAQLQRRSGATVNGDDDLVALVASVRDLLGVSEAMSVELTAATATVFGRIVGAEAASAFGMAPQLSDLADVVVRRETVGELFAAGLPADRRAEWAVLQTNTNVQTFESAIAAIANGGTPVEDDLPAIAQAGLLRSQLVNGLLARLLDEIGSIAERRQRTADVELQRTMLVLASTVGATLVVLVAGSFVISRPLARLGARAYAVHNGDLQPPSRVGCRVAQIDDVETAFEDIVANLRSVEEQATALVEGRADFEPIDERPGPLGESVRASLRRLAEVTEELQASEALSNAIVETAAEAIWTLDRDGIIVRANAAAAAMLGASPVWGRRFLDEVSETERDAVAELMAAGALDSFEVAMRHRDGRAIPALLSSSSVELGAERFTTVLARDITERKHLEAMLEENAATDPLTGLPNRRTAMAVIGDALEAAGTNGTGVAIVFCDLDGFKEANDVYGHAFGDGVLREVARRFRTEVRDGEMLARLGGDEFLVIVEGSEDVTAGTAAACRLLATLDDAVVIGQRRVRVSGSFGVAWGASGAAASDLLRDADMAMFTAKTAGGARVQVFDAVLQQDMRARLDIEAGLRKALDEDELTFVYQPVISAGSHRLEGVEALVRWNRPGHGVVPPAMFIPVAEQSDLIVHIGRWGLRTAVRQLAEWDTIAAHDFFISVNIAGVHLARYDVVGDVQAALAGTGVDPRRLRIEITETQLVDDLGVASEAMRRLDAMGVSVVIDDYGTGFTSISYLRELPLRGIKVDRSFINRLGTPRERAMVESLVALARLLDLQVVAEGVETHEQLTLAERIGCDALQGYHIARPMPVDELTAWVAEGRSTVAR